MKTMAHNGRLGLLLVLLLLALAAAGRERTAAGDPGGCDVVVGPDESYSSIQVAIDDPANYTTICVRGGVYEEAVRVRSDKPGRALVAFGDGTPVIDGIKLLPSGAATNQSLALVELQGVGTTLDGFEIRHSSGRALDVNASGVTVRNSSIHDNWGPGIIVRGPSNVTLTDVLIENNQIYNNLLKVRDNPLVYRVNRTGTAATDWEIDLEEMWNEPFWSGARADLPESYLNDVVATLNTDGAPVRVYATSPRTFNSRGTISANYSATNMEFTYSGRDILFHEPAGNKWTKYFDGATWGLPENAVIDAFLLEPSQIPECPACAPIVMSFDVTGTVEIDDTVVGPGDLVRFSPTDVDVWGRINGGAFSLYKSAADLGLPTDANIDALDRTPDGRLAVSFAADHQIGSVQIDMEDLAVYDFDEVAQTGTWSLYFDGDQILYNPFPGDLTAAWLDADGNLYVSANPVGGSALVFIETADSVARGNFVYNNFGEGLVAGRFSENITLEDNVVYDNYHANLYMNSTTNPLVRRNLIYCTDDLTFMRKGGAKFYTTSAGIQIRDERFVNVIPSPPTSSGQLIINNIVVGCSINFSVTAQLRTDGQRGGLRDGLVANNTFANARGEASNTGGAGIFNVAFNNQATYVNSSFVNNLILQYPTMPGDIVRQQGGNIDFSTLTVANNLYSKTPNGNWFPTEPGRVVGDPQFLVPPPPPPALGGPAPDPLEYRLADFSPAVDAGVPLAPVTDDYFGQLRAGSGAPDIGAYEFPHAADLTIQLTTNPPGAAQVFSFTAPGLDPQTFELADGQQQAYGPMQGGVYSVSAAPVAGWATTAECTDGSSVDAITLGPIESMTCTFTNVQLGQIDVSVTPTPATLIVPGGEVSFAVNVVNAGPAMVLSSLSDSIFGNVADGDNPLLSSTTCALPQDIAVDGSYSCTFTANVSGAAGSTHGSILTAGGTGPGNYPVSATADVSVAIQAPALGRIVVEKQTEPPDASGALFEFTTSFGNFTLSHGQSHDSGDLPSEATYAVAGSEPAGWTRTSATCDDGSDPAAIYLDPGETVTCTFVSSPVVVAADVYYLTTPKAGKVRGLAYAPGDILAYDTAADAWSIHFDASIFGIKKALNDFVLMDDGSILMAFKPKIKLPGQNGAPLTLTQQDVARFVPTTPGDNTTGWFEFFLDGSDVELTKAGEKIDAIAWLDDGPNGTLLISTTGAAAVKDADGKNLKAQKEDLLAFEIETSGETTKGVWRTYFDGTPIPGLKAENLTSAYVDSETGTIYLTVMNAFTIKGIKGKNQTVLAITPAGDVSVFWTSADAGFAKPIDGFTIAR